MHSVSHALVNGLAGYLLGFEPRVIVLLVVAGVVIDIDHFLYYLVTSDKPVRALLAQGARHWLYYQPRLFLFHTLEFNLFVLLLGLLVHPFFLYLELAFLIHMAMDVYDYVLHLGDFRWLKHWFVTYYVLRYMDRKARQASAAARKGLVKARAKVRAERVVLRRRLTDERARVARQLRARRLRFVALVREERRKLAVLARRDRVLLAAKMRKLRGKLGLRKRYAGSGALE